MRFLSKDGRAMLPRHRKQSLALDLAALAQQETDRRSFRLYDWLDTQDYQISTNGAGSDASGSGAGEQIRDIGLSTGTDTTGRAGAGSASLSFMVPQVQRAAYVLETHLYVGNLSDGTNTFTIRLGFLDSISGEAVDGAYFRYTNGVNSGKWEAVTRTNSTETTGDTGVAAIAGWNVFGVAMLMNENKALFFCATGEHRSDPPFVAQVSGIPTTPRDFGLGASIIKSAGTTNRQCWVQPIELTVISGSA